MSEGNVFHGNVDFGQSRNTTITGSITNNYGSDPNGERLLQLVAELRRVIAAHERELDDPEGMRESADMLREQVRGGDPKPGRLRALLASMAAMAGNVTAITAAVSAVRAALGG